MTLGDVNPNWWNGWAWLWEVAAACCAPPRPVQAVPEPLGRGARRSWAKA
jgi:hypothetical protein